MSKKKVLELKNLSRNFGELKVLDKVQFSLYAGETVALLGPSGSGKSSLLHMAGLLEAPSSGEVMINDVSTAGLSDNERTRIRREDVGFVYQFHHLLPEFDALGNVVLPQLIAGKSKDKASEKARKLLSVLGLSERFHHQPGQLSGGEQQRTAIARALSNSPKILLADEPTGNLDLKTSAIVFDELLKITREEGLAVLIATHDQNLAKRMDHIVTIKDYTIVPFEG